MQQPITVDLEIAPLFADWIKLTHGEQHGPTSLTGAILDGIAYKEKK